MKINLLLIMVSFSLTNPTFGQENNNLQKNVSDTSLSSKTNEAKVETQIVEEMPSFPGGEMALLDFVNKNKKYPKEAKRNNIKGKVIVTFVVDKEGNVRDEKIFKGIGGGCDEEALRIVQLMPRWTPGKQNGRPVNVLFHLPIGFGL